MRTPVFPVKAGLLFVFMTLLPACHPNQNWENESTDLLHHAIALEQEHAAINAGIDSLWDVTTLALEKALPPDFPPVDREIFLTSRNADHIRMFMTFKTLPSDIQAMVDAAGKEDERLAVKARILMEEKQEFEKEKNQFLQSIEQQDTSVRRFYADQFRKIENPKQQ